MKLNWGFVGNGRIVHRFLAGMKEYPDAIPYAVYGRNMNHATDIQQQYGMKKAYDNYDAFLADDTIDVVYIAVTHPYHLEYAKKALAAKKPVLCEKPMTPNYGQTLEMIQCAKENHTFLMEAMWTRTFPVNMQVNKWIQEGKIGDVVAMNGTFGINAPCEGDPRMIVMEEAGGALLDIGVYLLAYSQMVFKEYPTKITGLANKASTGADIESSIILRYGENKLSSLTMSFRAEFHDTVSIYGTKGKIDVYDDFWRARGAKLTCEDGYIEITSPVPQDASVYGSKFSFVGEGFQNEIAHVHDCIEKGLTESPLMPLQDSIHVIKICDELRAQWDIKYPFEV